MTEKDTRTWGYSRDDAKIFPDANLPEGYYPHPDLIPDEEAKPRRGRPPKQQDE